MYHAENIAGVVSLVGARLYTNKRMASNIALYERFGVHFREGAPHDLGTVAVHMATARNSKWPSGSLPGLLRISVSQYTEVEERDFDHKKPNRSGIYQRNLR